MRSGVAGWPARKSVVSALALWLIEEERIEARRPMVERKRSAP